MLDGGQGASLSGPSEEWKERLLCRGRVISRASKALTHTEDPPYEEAYERLLVTELHRDLFSLASDTLLHSPHSINLLSASALTVALPADICCLL